MHQRTRDAFCFDLRHVAVNALASGTPGFMVSVLFQRSGTRAVRGRRAVAVKADLIRGFAQLRVVVRAMHIVA